MALQAVTQRAQVRRTAEFHPSVWGDYFIKHVSDNNFEQERGHVASAVECCMKQYGVSKQEAYEKLNKIVANMWKDLNEELMKEIDIPKPILMCILNIVRVMDVVYKDEDSYTHSNTSLKDILATFLVTPVAV
ncbi:hypothetical protein JCGZ_14801 [Jatropha curcas]|uniref:Terpene synthase metal-binding domain-containing protein n=1 Tax=Jatropha curcas TaxID=180498 RepID=A0A067K5S1_JATCU|nr:hypothetical protein JCGZ_14801 [Jatropha curcas]